MHELALHEVRRLEKSVTSVSHEVESIVDDGLIEKDSVSSEEVASVAGDLGSSLWFEHVEASHDLMMMQMTHSAINLFLFDFSPGMDDLIEVLILAG
jgi:hypothetical protein